jgi:hypothetical protein
MIKKNDHHETLDASNSLQAQSNAIPNGELVNYLAPSLEVMSIHVEQGFATSPGGTTPGFGDSDGFGA